MQELEKEVLQLEFFDVYWELDDLTEGEKEYYRKHGSEVAEIVERLAKRRVHVPRV